MPRLIAFLLAAGMAFLGARVAPAASFGSQEVVLYSGTVSATGDLPISAPPYQALYPTGHILDGICVLDVTAVSGTNPTLDLYLQSTVGAFDDDYCRFAQATGVSRQVLRFSTQCASTSSAATTASDRSSGISAGNCRAGQLGGKAKLAAVLGGTNSPTVTFSVTCNFVGD